MKSVALTQAAEHRTKYNIIIHNPVDGEFMDGASTYEMVADSYFNRERPNVLKITDTDQLEIENIERALAAFEGYKFDEKEGVWRHTVSSEFDRGENTIRATLPYWRSMDGLRPLILKMAAKGYKTRIVRQGVDCIVKFESHSKEVVGKGDNEIQATARAIYNYHRGMVNKLATGLKFPDLSFRE